MRLKTYPFRQHALIIREKKKKKREKKETQYNIKISSHLFREQKKPKKKEEAKTLKPKRIPRSKFILAQTTNSSLFLQTHRSALNCNKNVDTEREGKTEKVPILQKNKTQIQREKVRVPSPDLEHRYEQKEKSMGITASTPLGYISATIRLSELAPVRFSLFF